MRDVIGWTSPRGSQCCLKQYLDPPLLRYKRIKIITTKLSDGMLEPKTYCQIDPRSLIFSGLSVAYNSGIEFNSFSNPLVHGRFN